MSVARLGRAEDVVAKVWTVDGRPVQQSTRESMDQYPTRANQKLMQRLTG